MEYRLRREFDPEWVFGIEGLGFEVEYNGFNGKDTTALRYGLLYKHSLSGFFDKTSWLQWRYHPVESFERGQQASIIYRMGFSLFFSFQVLLITTLTLMDNQNGLLSHS